MKIPVFLVVCLFSPLLALAQEYKLVWADEFNIDGRPDPKNWGYERGFVRNGELQWYQPDNASCSGGNLIIEARRERVQNPDYRPGSRSWRRNREFAEYTSACLLTRGLHSWQYGRFEVRARIKAEPGLWPAIWFLGVSGRWPSNGEIDLMEYYKGDIHANACWTGEWRQPKWDAVKTPVKSFNDPEWDSKYHVWRMDWDEESIKLYVDDQLLNETKVSEAVNPEGVEPREPFRQPQYLLINLAIGGLNGGDPSSTKFPSRYEVDYVRVYQKQ